MDKGLKIALVILITLILFMVCACCVMPGLFIEGIKRNLSVDPLVISKTTQNMVDYQAPPGYKQVGGDFLSLFKFVAITAGSNSNFTILLLQSPFINQSNINEFEEGIVSDGRSSGSDVQWRSMGKTQLFIDGSFCDMDVSEGSDSRGILFRNMTGVINGRSGPVIFMVRGRVDQWDQDGLYAFLRSIKK